MIAVVPAQECRDATIVVDRYITGSAVSKAVFGSAGGAAATGAVSARMKLHAVTAIHHSTLHSPLRPMWTVLHHTAP
jgi:hypothetical protein